MAYSESKRPMPRPLVTVSTTDFPQSEPGAKAYRALPDAKSAQTAELVAVDPAHDVRPALPGAGTPGGPGGDPAFPREGAGALLPAWHVTVRLTGGMGSGRVPREGSVPAVGDFVCFTFFEHEPRGGPALPEADRTPWTHGGPPGGSGTADSPDRTTPEDYL
jgi:hypothetical protein